MEVQRTLDIPAPAEAVWAVLADFAAISRWAPDVDHSAPASDPADGIGAVRRVQAGRITLLETVTDWQDGQVLAYTVEGLPPVAGRIETTWRLTASEAGVTHATVTTVLLPPPKPAGRIVARVLSRRLATAAGRMLSGLSHHLQERAQ